MRNSELSSDQQSLAYSLYALTNHNDLHVVTLLKAGEELSHEYQKSHYRTAAEVIEKTGGGVNWNQEIEGAEHRTVHSVVVIDHVHMPDSHGDMLPNGTTVENTPLAKYEAQRNMVSRDYIPGQVFVHELIGHGGARSLGHGDHTDAIRMENVLLRIHSQEYWRVGLHHSEAIRDFNSQGVPRWATIPASMQERIND